MSTATAPETRRGVDVRPLWRQVAVPAEHGGWSLTVEPVVLGLFVAWSRSGVLLGLAAVLAFLARTPLKLVLVDRWRDRWLDRTRLAALIGGCELLAIAVLGVLGAQIAGDGRWWVPLAVAAPLVAVELWYDMRSRGRRLVPELAGAMGISSIAVAIALAGGRSMSISLGLWCVLGARAAAAIPHVRTQIFRLHRRPVRRWHSDLAQASAVAAVVIGWALGGVTIASVAGVAVVSALNVALVRRPPRPAVTIGIQQMLFGIAVVAVTAASVLITA